MRRLTVFAALLAGLLATPAIAETNWVYDTAKKELVSRNDLNQGGGKRYYRSDKSPIPRRTVAFDAKYGAGTIVVNTGERRLYYTLGNGKAIRYGVGVGRDGFTWSGTHRVTRKAEWPGWTPPATMIRREAAKGRKLPAYMPGGPDNPLGARALYIGSTIYRIHGTNQPWTIGQAMSSGCIRMANEDVTHLYSVADVGTKVVVVR